jgi:hypothetical protein
MDRACLKYVVGLAVGVWLFGPTLASAQYTKQTTCVGKKTLPVSDKHYIKKFCGPTVCPGSCFGYFPTKWTRWEDACAGDGTCGDPSGVMFQGVGTVIEQAPQAGPGTTAPATKPATPVETAPVPKPATPKTGEAGPSSPLPLPTPTTPPTIPGTTPPAQQPGKPGTTATAIPNRFAPTVSGFGDVAIPQVTIQYPSSSPTQFQTTGSR